MHPEEEKHELQEMLRVLRKADPEHRVVAINRTFYNGLLRITPDSKALDLCVQHGLLVVIDRYDVKMPSSGVVFSESFVYKITRKGEVFLNTALTYHIAMSRHHDL